MSRVAFSCSASSAAAAGVAGNGPWSAPFFACVLLLLAGAMFVTVGKRLGWLTILKEAVPLQRSLDAFPTEVGPYRLTLQPRLSPELEHELGTREYAVWKVQDTQAGPTDPWRNPTLSVTYYTGKVDQVPHVPEECLFQGGKQQVGGLKSSPMQVAMPGGTETVAVRTVAFRNQLDSSGIRVFYTIRCNTSFYEERNDVRRRMTDRTEKHLYYSKVEVSYFVPDVTDAGDRIAAEAERLMNAVLPRLAAEFWPDWRRVEPAATKQ